MKISTMIILGVIAVFCLIGGVSACGNYNKFIKLEEQVEAIHKDMENVHGSINNNIKSQGLTTEKYGTMVLESIKAAMSGRYGSGGSKAAVQWIQEKNPEIDSEMFKKLQNVIEASYNKFENVQRSKIDVLRQYKTELRSFPNNIYAGLFGFPKSNLKDLEEVISTEDSKEMMKTKKMKVINPF
jgi:LemA protein